MAELTADARARALLEDGDDAPFSGHLWDMWNVAPSLLATIDSLTAEIARLRSPYTEEEVERAARAYEAAFNGLPEEQVSTAHSQRALVAMRSALVALED